MIPLSLSSLTYSTASSVAGKDPAIDSIAVSLASFYGIIK